MALSQLGFFTQRAPRLEAGSTSAAGSEVFRYRSSASPNARAIAHPPARPTSCPTTSARIAVLRISPVSRSALRPASTATPKHARAKHPATALRGNGAFKNPLSLQQGKRAQRHPRNLYRPRHDDLESRNEQISISALGSVHSALPTRFHNRSSSPREAVAGLSMPSTSVPR